MEGKYLIKNKWILVPIVILLILLVSEALWYAPYTPLKEKSLRVLSVTQDREGNVTVTYELNADLPSDVTVVVTPVTKNPTDLPVYVFYDRDYPAAGTSWGLIHILWVHLKAELYLRGYVADVELANAEELENLFSTNSSAVVIMASGALPSNLFSWEKNLVKPWIEAGGTLIWFGWIPGYYSVDKGQSIYDVKPELPQNPRHEGPRLLGLEGFFECLVDNPTVAENESPLSKILDTSYNLIQQAPFIYMVNKTGLILGKFGGEWNKLRVSISMVSMGEGRIILFGYFLTSSLTLNGPELAARDIAQILCSGVMYMSNVSAPWYQSYHLSRGEMKTDSSKFEVNSEAVGVVIYAYPSRESIGLLFHREFRLWTLE